MYLVTDPQTVQGIVCLSSEVSWEYSPPPQKPKQHKRCRKWMDDNQNVKGEILFVSVEQKKQSFVFVSVEQKKQNVKSQHPALGQKQKSK